MRVRFSPIDRLADYAVLRHHPHGLTIGGDAVGYLDPPAIAARYHGGPHVERARSSSKYFASRSACLARSSETSLIDEFLCCLASSRQRCARARQAAPARARSPLSILYPNSPLFVVFDLVVPENQSLGRANTYVHECRGFSFVSLRNREKNPAKAGSRAAIKADCQCVRACSRNAMTARPRSRQSCGVTALEATLPPSSCKPRP